MSLQGRRPPRVLQVVLSLNPGGTERLVLEMVTRLQREISMAVCCLDDEGAWAGKIKTQGVEIRPLHRASGFRPALGGAIARAAARHDAQIIHCHHYSPFVYGCLARLWRRRARVIYTEHGRLSDALPSSKRRLANRLLSRSPHAVFAVSEDLKQHLVSEGFRPEAVGVIYNGIAVGPVPDAQGRARARQNLGVSDEIIVIATIGRLDPVKDLGVLVRALPAVAREMPVMLVIIGDGSECRALEATVATSGIEHCVRFLGHRDDARALLAGCDVYANSSISEGVSLTILEAMAARLPIVATKVGGTPEVVDATCGRLVPARKSGALADALGELARRPLMRIEMGQAARHRVEAQFTLDRMVTEYRDVYYGVAEA